MPEIAELELTLHGHRVRYLTAGSGPPLVLVHGITSSADTWTDAMRGLARDHTVIAPDLLGHGASAKPRGDYSLGAYASGVRDLLAALGHDRVTLVGHSLGGGVAMAFAYHYPHRVERLGLVSSGGLGRSVSIGLRAATVPGAGPLMRTIGARPVVAVVRRSAAVARSCGLRQVARVVLGLSHTLERIADSARRSAFLKTARAVIDGHGQKVSALDRFGAMGDMPVLVLWGTRDAIIPADHAHRVKEVDPDAELVMLEGIGHTPQLSQPAFVAEQIATWIRTTEPARLDGRPRAMLEPVTAP
jgi:pimeloyl-ACP methyl ester carboxylesterase